MKKLLLFLLTSIILYSCGPDKPIEPTTQEIMKEKEAVMQVIQDYNNSYQSKNFAGMIETLSEDVIFFGTDSAEVIKSLVDYKKQMQNQWDLYEQMAYGKMYDVFIQMDKMATMASVIFGIPLDVKLHGKDQHYFLRIARTLKKENNKWVIVSGIVSIASTGQSTSDLILTKPDSTKAQDNSTIKT